MLAYLLGKLCIGATHVPVLRLTPTCVIFHSHDAHAPTLACNAAMDRLRLLNMERGKSNKKDRKRGNKTKNINFEVLKWITHIKNPVPNYQKNWP